MPGRIHPRRTPTENLRVVIQALPWRLITLLNTLLL